MKQDSPPFARFQAALDSHPSAFRCAIDAHNCEAVAGEWRLLGLECDDALDLANDHDPLDYPPKRRTPHHGTPTSTSTAAGRVQLDHGDPLKTVPASVYLPALGVELSSSGRFRCPMPDHEDEHPSCKAYGARWTCFACGAGGSIIDAAAAVYGIDARGPDYWRLRDRILEALGWAPLPSEVGR